MTEHVRQVLDMLAAGKITAEEADRLIDALGASSRAASSAKGTEADSKKPRFLRVMVDAVDPHEGPIKVNVRVPLVLLRAGVRLASLIPTGAQERVNQALREQGIDLDITKVKPENLNELIDGLSDLSVDVGNEREDLKIKVFTE